MPAKNEGNRKDETPPSPPADPALGLQCPKCHGRLFYVLWTTRLNGRIRRRRECRHCGRRMTTIEQEGAE